MTGLILPGIGDSGPEHWQTHWESSHAGFARVRQRDWDRPDCREWAVTLESAVRSSTTLGKPVFLVAHSLACLLVARWAVETQCKVAGAFLVALPDPEGPAFPKEAMGFSPLPKQAIPFPTLVVASGNDPYGTLEFSRDCARTWGGGWIQIGLLGHINSASGLGDWGEGYRLFQAFATGASR